MNAGLSGRKISPPPPDDEQMNMPAVPDLPEIELPLAALCPNVIAGTVHNSLSRFGKGMTGKHSVPRVAQLYEIELFTKTGGIAVIDGQKYPIARGDVRIHRPGQIVWSFLHYECYALRLTLDGNQPPAGTFQPRYRNPLLDRLPAFLTASEPDKYIMLMDETIRTLINPRDGSPLLLRAKALELLYFLYRDACQMEQFGVPGHVSDAVVTAMAYMGGHYQEAISLEDIARATNLSPNYFHRVFTAAATMTPLAYLTKVRLEHARELLLTNNWPISEVAQACGFESASYFTLVFRKNTGFTPGDYRRHKQLDI